MAVLLKPSGLDSTAQFLYNTTFEVHRIGQYYKLIML